jgi:hypothetical protein
VILLGPLTLLRVACAQVRLEDLFKKTKAKPEIFWKQNPKEARERILKRLKETSARPRDAPGRQDVGPRGGR